jgi:hypothetical protein
VCGTVSDTKQLLLVSSNCTLEKTKRSQEWNTVLARRALKTWHSCVPSAFHVMEWFLLLSAPNYAQPGVSLLCHFRPLSCKLQDLLPTLLYKTLALHISTSPQGYSCKLYTKNPPKHCNSTFYSHVVITFTTWCKINSVLCHKVYFFLRF